VAKKKIISIEAELASDDVEYCGFDSDSSLLDWDIILFKPVIYEFASYADHYQGKPSLSDSSSFHLKERAEHWRREIKDAVESGKTVIVFLAELYEVYIDTGRREYSGTGRNQKTTRIVDSYDNYRCIPAQIGPVKTKGSAMKLTPRGAELLSSYWKDFEKYSKYQVILSGEKIPTSITTKNGEKSVAAIYRSKNSNGALILLPDIDFYDDSFLEEKDDKQVWTKTAGIFSSKMVAAVVAIDKSLKNQGDSTPEPEWAKEEEFELLKETEVRTKLLTTEEKIETLQAEKAAQLDELRNLGRLRNLLYEKGKPLEYSIIDALLILGFNAEQYHDTDSEFDVVFESKEGRFIGEAEGKDNKAINIDKLRQLEMNIHEDLDRDEVEEPAKAVLFGNAFRLEPVNNRGVPFTTKCVSASERSSTALVFTPDLFRVARYLSNKKDARFATKCRKVILSTTGRVVFPEVPEIPNQLVEDASEKET
jgi:hypothetical protein